MRTRTIVLLLVAAVILAGGGVATGAAVFGGDDDPPFAVTTTGPTTAATTTKSETTTTPSPSATEPTATRPTTAITPPPVSTPETAKPPVLNGAVTKEVLPGLTSPIPPAWVGQGSDSDSHAYADTSSCTTKEKDCPRIEFLSLTVGANRVNYGTDPIHQWARNVCPQRSPDSVVTLDPIVVDSVTVGVFQLPCQGLENWAWYVPGKLLVLTGDANGGTASPVTVQAVLLYSSFD